MAAYISVPRDLGKVKSKVFFNLTKRQLICFSMAAAVGVPLFFLVKKSGNVSLAVLCMMAVMLPFFFFAMYEKDGMPLEVILDHFIEAKFRRPKDRPYCTDNYYTALIRQYQAEKEVEEIVFQSEKKAEGKRNASAAKVAQQKGAQAGGKNHPKRKAQ